MNIEQLKYFFLLIQYAPRTPLRYKDSLIFNCGIYSTKNTNKSKPKPIFHCYFVSRIPWISLYPVTLNRDICIKTQNLFVELFLLLLLVWSDPYLEGIIIIFFFLLRNNSLVRSAKLPLFQISRWNRWPIRNKDPVLIWIGLAIMWMGLAIKEENRKMFCIV